ncbi:MAG: TIGR03905 family TSCPD domain-containing protein [Firmicutes bacterium]|nr:TIGR03905 family TSCPD domain-containing protein [Bacillota bacterium]
MYTYKTQGTCAKAIHLNIESGTITHCSFDRGCSGNGQGLSRLLIGMKVDDAIEKLKGIQCQNGTSCPDQLAKALEIWRAEHA